MKGVGSLGFILLFGGAGLLHCGDHCCFSSASAGQPEHKGYEPSLAGGGDKKRSIFFKCYHPAGESAVGDVIKVTNNVVSPEACQEECKKMHECTYFAYVPVSKKCRLFKKNPTETRAQKGVITGPKKCHSSCFLLDTVYASDVLVSGEKFSPYDCQIWCIDTDGCQYWSWEGAKNGVNGRCHLITDEYAFRSATHFDGAVSGSRDMCDEDGEDADDETLDCIHKDALPKSGEKHKTLTGIRSFLHCRSVCHKEGPCRYWSYNTGDKSCTLWKGDATDIELGHNTFITGPRACNNYCTQTNATIGGDELAPPKQKLGAYDCLMSCFHVEGCKYIRYEDATQLCHYLGAETDDVGLQENVPGWTFGDTLFCD